MRYAYAIILALTFFACQSKEEILTKTTWCIVDASFNGTPVEFKTRDVASNNAKDESPNIEPIRFTKGLVVYLPGVNSPRVPYDWNTTADGFELTLSPALVSSPVAESFDAKGLSDALKLDSTAIPKDNVTPSSTAVEVAADTADETLTMASFSFQVFSDGLMEEVLKIYPERLQADIVNDTLYLRGTNLVIKACSLKKVLE